MDKKIIVEYHEVNTGDHYLAKCDGLTLRAESETEARTLMQELLDDIERDNIHIDHLYKKDRTF